MWRSFGKTQGFAVYMGRFFFRITNKGSFRSVGLFTSCKEHRIQKGFCAECLGLFPENVEVFLEFMGLFLESRDFYKIQRAFTEYRKGSVQNV